MIAPPFEDDYLYAITLLNDITRRSVDGTVPPLFVDYTNQRIIVGSTTASGTSKFQVFGDIFVVTTGKGYVFPDGTKQTTAAGGGSPTSVNPFYAWNIFGGF